MRTFRKEAGDGQSYSHCRWAGESYAHRRWAGPNPLNGRQTFPPFASLLSVFNCMKLQEDDTHLHSPEIAEVDRWVRARLSKRFGHLGYDIAHVHDCVRIRSPIS